MALISEPLGSKGNIMLYVANQRRNDTHTHVKSLIFHIATVSSCQFF